MERIGHKHLTLAEAAEAERREMWAMSPEERLAIARELQMPVYGRDCPDVRVGRIGRIVRQESNDFEDLANPTPTKN